MKKDYRTQIKRLTDKQILAQLEHTQNRQLENIVWGVKENYRQRKILNYIELQVNKRDLIKL